VFYIKVKLLTILKARRQNSVCLHATHRRLSFSGTSHVCNALLDKTMHT